MKEFPKGRLIPPELHQTLRERFAYITADHHGTERLFLDNSGGSLRLKSAESEWLKIDEIPDCPERYHKVADELNAIIDEGKEAIKKIVGSSEGVSLLQHTASMGNFELILLAAEHLSGSNIVTTALEHPSSFDACVRAAEKFGKELRVAGADPKTGAVREEDILNLVDENTAFANLIYASNLTGAILELEPLVKKLREKVPGLYVISDAVQHTPHHLIHFEKTGLDAVTFAPYKMFGPRGVGVSFLSERFSKLPHSALNGKPSSEWGLGSPSPAFYRAITEIFNYVEWLGFEIPDLPGDNAFERGMNAIFLHEKALLHYLLHGDKDQPGLLEIPGLKVHFLDDGIENRDCILAISIGDEDPSLTTKRYAEQNVTVYERASSSIYSRRMLEALDLKGVVRVSPLHVQTTDEMKKFLEVTTRLARQNP